MNNSFKFPVGLGMVGAGLAVSAIQKNKGNGVNYNNNSFKKTIVPKSSLDSVIKDMDFYSLCLEICNFNQVKDRLNEYDFKSNFKQIQEDAKKYNRDDYFIPPYFFEMYKLLKKSYEKCIKCWGNNPYGKQQPAGYICLQDFVMLDRALKGWKYFHHNPVYEEMSPKVREKCECINKPVQVLDNMERKIVFANSLEVYYNKWREEREKYLNKTQNNLRPLFSNEFKKIHNEINNFNEDNLWLSGEFIVPDKFKPECFEDNPYYFSI